MRKINLLFIVFCLLSSEYCFGGDSLKGKDRQPSTFELKDSDKVVLLGNSLFEYDLKYGYIEFALTSRWPDRDIIFRNLGWSGDTVFGESRGYFTTPPDAYGHLVEQLTTLKPTVVFVAYGAVEAFEGEEGITRFTDGLSRLLDQIDELGAEVVLLSPVPHFSTVSLVSDPGSRNENLKRYSGAISETAKEREIRFLDLFSPLLELDRKVQLSTNGIHLNETGYYHLAKVIEKGLGLRERSGSIEIDMAGVTVRNNGLEISEVSTNDGELEFIAKPSFLPIPEPGLSDESIRPLYRLKITGLDRGSYLLSVDGDTTVIASVEEWAEGVEIEIPSLARQAAELCDLILEKNEYFFHRYRPQNRTYLTGFRSYEQGQNVVELEQLGLLVEQLENRISQKRSPKSNMYRLTLVR